MPKRMVGQGPPYESAGSTAPEVLNACDTAGSGRSCRIASRRGVVDGSASRVSTHRTKGNRMASILTIGSDASAPEATAVPLQRQSYVDVFRGLLIAHMALDHTSLMFNAGRYGEEIAADPAPVPPDLIQFFLRFTGVPVAPAFFFMAGFMVAMTSLARAGRGVPEHVITR